MKTARGTDIPIWSVVVLINTPLGHYVEGQREMGDYYYVEAAATPSDICCPFGLTARTPYPEQIAVGGKCSVAAVVLGT